MTEALFTTPRLYCRRWLASDIDDIYAVYADEEGARWVGDGTPITREESEQWLEVTFNNYATRGYGMFTIADRATDRTVGFIGLVHPGGQPEVEIKYAFYRHCWGRGYASEVVPALLSHAENELGLQHVIATVSVENAASQRVLLKSGMQYVKVFEEEDGRTQLYEWRGGQA